MDTTETDKIEAQRREIIGVTVNAMRNADEVVDHDTLAARIEAAFPGFHYDPATDDNYQNISVADVLADVEARELADGMATAKPSSAEVLRAKVRELDQAAADARAHIVVLNAQLARARSTMADSLRTWYTGARTISHEQNSRAFIASELSERARIAEHGGPSAAEQPQVNSSVIDRSAAYSAGGNASDYTRKQFRGGGFRRGSYSAAMKSANIRPRLPSDRV